MTASGVQPRLARCGTSDDETAALRCSLGRAWRSDSTLLVRADTGRPLSWLSHGPSRFDGDDGQEWSYAGALTGPLGLYHILRGRFYESETYTLVNGRTGRAADLVDATLALSPDGVHFAVSVFDDVCEGEAALELWRLTDSVAVRELRIDPYDCSHDRGWGPSDLVWQGPDTLRFVAHEVLGDVTDPSAEHAIANHPVRDRPGLIVRSLAGWTLVGLPATPPAAEAPTSDGEPRADSARAARLH